MMTFALKRDDKIRQSVLLPWWYAVKFMSWVEFGTYPLPGGRQSGVQSGSGAIGGPKGGRCGHAPQRAECNRKGCKEGESGETNEREI